ncbi:MAG: hypothetical protein LBM99_01890 [Bacillales bacterium]|jgi:predicted transcriptional regulator of viral defense system|nr:hypothetical protein [Bacillales bacterium]
MRDYTKLLSLSVKGVVTTQAVMGAGLPKNYLSYAVRDGFITREMHGVYIVNGEGIIDDYYMLQFKRKKIIFSFDTAAFLHDLITHFPWRMSVTVPSGWNAKGLNKNCKVYYYGENYELGIVEVETFAGNKVRVYDMERTLCDMFSSRYDGDIALSIEALQSYLRLKEKCNFQKLYDYAKKLGVYNEINKRVQVLV